MLDLLPILIKFYTMIKNNRYTQLEDILSTRAIFIVEGDLSWPMTGSFCGVDAVKVLFEDYILPARNAAKTSYIPTIEQIRLINTHEVALSVCSHTRFGNILEYHTFCIDPEINKILHAKLTTARKEDKQLLANIYARKINRITHESLI